MVGQMMVEQMMVGQMIVRQLPIVYDSLLIEAHSHVCICVLDA